MKQLFLRLATVKRAGKEKHRPEAQLLQSIGPELLQQVAQARLHQVMFCSMFSNLFLNYYITKQGTRKSDPRLNESNGRISTDVNSSHQPISTHILIDF